MDLWAFWNRDMQYKPFFTKLNKFKINILYRWLSVFQYCLQNIIRVLPAFKSLNTFSVIPFIFNANPDFPAVRICKSDKRFLKFTWGNFHTFEIIKMIFFL